MNKLEQAALDAAEFGMPETHKGPVWTVPEGATIRLSPNPAESPYEGAVFCGWVR
jgi:hypothetical protein